LAALVAAAEQDHHGISMPSEIHPISGADMDTQFDDTLSDRITVAEVASFDLTQTDTNPRCSDFVADAGEPLAERLSATLALVSEQFYHKRFVA
jgi:hypothetical protein